MIKKNNLIPKIKILLFAGLLLWSGFGFVSSSQKLNEFTTIKIYNNEPLGILEDFKLNENDLNNIESLETSNDYKGNKVLTKLDLAKYNELVIKRFEYTLLFVAFLILFMSDVKGLGPQFKRVFSK